MARRAGRAFGPYGSARLAAKPVIDIMAGVESLDASRDAIAAAGGLGLRLLPVPAQCARHALVLQAPRRRSGRTICIFVPFNSPLWGSSGWRSAISCERIRRWPQYADLKGRLATEFEFEMGVVYRGERAVHSACPRAGPRAAAAGTDTEVSFSRHRERTVK